MTMGGSVTKEALQEQLDDMEHAEQQMRDVEDFDTKLAEEKEAAEKREAEKEEKRRLENRKAPHIANLNEDPMISQQIYYPLKEFPIRIGRRNDEPRPQIILGGVSVHRNHAQFNILPNGLIEFELTNQEAHNSTFINANLLPENGKRILNHLDTIYFGSGDMLLFKYPKMRVVGDLFAQKYEQSEGFNIQAAVMNDLKSNGICKYEGDPETLIEESYTDEQIQHDMMAVSWDKAFE